VIYLPCQLLQVEEKCGIPTAAASGARPESRTPDTSRASSTQPEVCIIGVLIWIFFIQIVYDSDHILLVKLTCPQSAQSRVLTDLLRQAILLCSPVNQAYANIYQHYPVC